MTVADLLASAQEALEAGDFEAAHAAAVEAAASDDGRALALLAGLEYVAGDFDGAERGWQAAFRRLRDAGELREAAQVAIELARLHGSDLGHPAAGRGWAERARRLLERVGPGPDWGYLEL